MRGWSPTIAEQPPRPKGDDEMSERTRVFERHAQFGLHALQPISHRVRVAVQLAGRALRRARVGNPGINRAEKHVAVSGRERQDWRKERSGDAGRFLRGRSDDH